MGIYISATVLVLIVIILIISAREMVPDKIETSMATIPFYKAGAFIYNHVIKDREGTYIQKIYDAKTILNPTGKTSEEVATYFVNKIGICVLILFMGNLIVLGSSIMDAQDTVIEEVAGENGDVSKLQQIKRGSFTGRNQSFVLSAETDRECIEDITVEIENRKYTDDQLKEMLPGFYKELERSFLGENESPDHVAGSICLAEEIEGYPFLIEYNWKEKSVLGSDGIIKQDIDENGTVVNINTVLRYEEFQYMYEFAINVFPVSQTKEQIFQKEIENELSDIQKKTATDEYFVLPVSVNGIRVVWGEKKQSNVVIFLLMIVAASVAVFLGTDKDLYGEIEKRKIQMDEDYPEIVSKITLLVGAGMTIRGSWKRIALEYREKKENGMSPRYAYEEMLLTLYEMESGVEETVCYSHFSRRVRVQKYVKLVSLLDQNLKMGSKGLLANLRDESRDAFEERKNQAEKKGEEAGTKLLLPMVLMLVVVMVVIMVPAFMSM